MSHKNPFTDEQIRTATDFETPAPGNREENSIFEFRIQKVNPVEAFLNDYYHCLLCGDPLDISHVTHFVDLEVNEEASCSRCGILARHDRHILQ